MVWREEGGRVYGIPNNSSGAYALDVRDGKLVRPEDVNDKIFQNLGIIVEVVNADPRLKEILGEK